jgi:Tfp pilus assembly protein PilN
MDGTPRLTFIDLNLLPQESWARNHGAIYASAAAVVLVAAVLLIPLNRANSNASGDAERLQDQVERIDAELAEAQVSLGRAREVRQQTHAAEQRLNELAAERSAVLGGGPWLSAAVGRLLGEVPPGVAISDITSGEGSLRLTGRAPDSAAALAYARQLDDAGAFSSVQIAALGLDEAGGVSFTVEVVG